MSLSISSNLEYPTGGITDRKPQISHFSTYSAGNLTFLLPIFPEFTDGWPQFLHFSTYFDGNLTALLLIFPEFTDGWPQFSHFSTYFNGNLTALPLVFPKFTDGWPQFLHFSTYFAENPAYHLPLITFFACQHPDIEILLLCELQHSYLS